MAAAWLEAGEAEKALAIFAEFESSSEIEILAARARAIRHAPRSDAGYVRHLFDQFSADYDSRMLGQLSYAAPQILRDLADLVMPGSVGESRRKNKGWPFSIWAAARAWRGDVSGQGRAAGLASIFRPP